MRKLWEVWLVWLLFGLATVAVFITYWRLPPSELWKTSQGGFVGGAGRAFVFVSFSAAIVAPATLAITADRLGSFRARALAVIALVLCATVAIPGVQTQGDLDAKWANVPQVAGVLLAVGLCAWATRSGRRVDLTTSRAGDRARLAVGAVSLFFAIPYIAAELGLFLDGVPFLGWFFQTGVLKPEPSGGHVHAAVHHGHHHGLDGFLLAVSALLLSRLLGGIRSRPLGAVTGFYLALMLVYGLTNQAEDLWTEQVAKRGWSHWLIPNVLQPKASAAWLAMLLVAALFYRLFFSPGLREGSSGLAAQAPGP